MKQAAEWDEHKNAQVKPKPRGFVYILILVWHAAFALLFAIKIYKASVQSSK